MVYVSFGFLWWFIGLIMHVQVLYSGIKQLNLFASRLTSGFLYLRQLAWPKTLKFHETFQSLQSRKLTSVTSKSKVTLFQERDTRHLKMCLNSICSPPKQITFHEGLNDTWRSSVQKQVRKRVLRWWMDSVWIKPRIQDCKRNIASCDRCYLLILVVKASDSIRSIVTCNS